MNNKVTASVDQTRASDPDASAWVTANAGSGKTHVLVNRVIRLLLTGTEPEKILCLTFTRAAAAQMSNRLFETLARWIPLDDDQLIEQIHQNTGHYKISKTELAAPRRLFARALETPGGLKIQTIHAFCEKLLHKFPLEAGVTPRFKVMDDRQAADLSAKIKNEFLFGLADTSELAQVVKYAGGQKGFDELLAHILEKREELRLAFENPKQALAALANHLNVPDAITVDDITNEIVDQVDRQRLQTFQALLADSDSKRNQEKADLIIAFLVSRNNAQAKDHLVSMFFKANLEIFSPGFLVSGEVSKSNPEILEYFLAQAERIKALLEIEKNLNTLEATKALIAIGTDIVSRYDLAKQNAGYYDYADLVARVLDMFSRMPDSAWVLYKLDGGIDHILVDEAQDTSPQQWQIIRFLADDFFAGDSARTGSGRTIFAVGDRKQSIYSFQGAAPEEFDRQKEYFGKMAKQANAGFSPVELLISYRSTGQILQTVDGVFAQQQAQKGVGKTVHEAIRLQENDRGLTELWPLIEPPDKQQTNAWTLPGKGDENRDPRVELAEKIAARIKIWLDEKIMLDSKNAPLAPDDILILVRNRTTLMPAIVRALKAAEIPVAGVDRLLLTDHIAVRDLLALARFTLLPQDDLALACLLKSPLPVPLEARALDDDDLIRLAAGRGGASVWQQLYLAADEDENYRPVYEQLSQWISLAKTRRPYEFFSTVLTSHQGRHRLLTRLGSEAAEPLDVFLELAREYERFNTPDLQGFVHWVSSGDAEIKRELEQNAGEVRVMTVHGAKGLEAPVVIIADSCEVPNGRRPPKIFVNGEGLPIWSLKKDLQASAAKQMASKHLDDNLDEYNRLFYVAMTRARDRLYIAGAQKQAKLKEESWYHLAAERLKHDKYRVDDEVFGSVWRFGQQPQSDSGSALAAGPETPGSKLPDWIAVRPAQLEIPEKWLSPSRLRQSDTDSPETHNSALAAQAGDRFVRGNIIHKLLQYLPDIDKSQRRAKAEAYLASNAVALDEESRGEMLKEVFNVLEDPVFADIFAEDSIAEVPVVGEVVLANDNRKVINGQIDRLCVTPGQVLVIDYKTNRPPPADIADADISYIRQLAAYRQVLSGIYPDRQIRAGLLWTHNATLMEVPAAQMDVALNKL